MSAPAARAAQLRELLALEPHPEGGYYRRIFRSQASVIPTDGRGERAQLSCIYYLLDAGARSHWHRVASDEVWHFIEGAPLELLSLNPALEPARNLLGPLSDQARPLRVVPAHHWQAARSLGEYSLVGCSVGPGFDFADFELMTADSPAAAELTAAWPELAGFILPG